MKKKNVVVVKNERVLYIRCFMIHYFVQLAYRQANTHAFPKRKRIHDNMHGKTANDYSRLASG